MQNTKLKKLLKQDVKENDFKNVAVFVNFFYKNYVNVDMCGGFDKYLFLKQSDAYVGVDDTFDFNKKINWLVSERNDLVD